MTRPRLGLPSRAALVTAASILAALLLLVPVNPSDAAADSTGDAVATTPGWTVYHGSAAGTGVASSIASVDTSAPAWTSPALDGKLYGEPLASTNQVYVATENDTVYALSSSSGAIVWATHIATPVPASSLPCGDISPTVGITGTPVVDPSRDEIFVVADELANGEPKHVLVGLNTRSGAIELRQDVDPPGADPAALLQRTGLTLDAGRVVFAMGGNYGDCAAYRGRVVAGAETGGPAIYFTVDAAAGDSQGAVWMGGAAPVVDRNGNIWVSVGNGSVTSTSQAYDDSDSALELSSSLRLLQFFAPTSWPQNNAEDLDMSMAPALLSDGQVVLAGKSRIVYLLNGSHLGGIGGQEASLPSGCGDDIDGGSAVEGTTVYLPCLTGVIAIQVAASPPSLSVRWTSTVGGGPPIVAGGLVWTIGENGVLYGLDPSTGALRQHQAIGQPANHFPTPGIGDGVLLTASANRVVAFKATSTGASTSAPSSTTTLPVTTTSLPVTTTTPSSVTRPSPTAVAHSRHHHGVGVATVAGSIAGFVVVIGLLIVVLRNGRWRSFRRRQ